MDNQMPIEKMLSGPIPGESLTRPPKSAPYEQPPKFTDISEAAEVLFEKLSQPTNAAKITALLEEGASAEMIVNTTLAAGFAEGEFNADMRMGLYRPALFMVAGIGKKYSNKPFKVVDEDYETQDFFNNLYSARDTGQEPNVQVLGAELEDPNRELTMEEEQAMLKDQIENGPAEGQPHSGTTLTEEPKLSAFMGGN